MTSTQLRSNVDKLWQQFWQGGITNPITVIEQITFLIFLRLLDIEESRTEKRMARTGETLNLRYDQDSQHLRWGEFSKQGDPNTKLRLVRDEVFKQLRAFGGDSKLTEHLRDARLAIDKPSLLVTAIELVSDLPLTDDDTKGDLYEYLLSKLNTAGIAGQFRTPRHIIDMMVEILDPKADERIADPSVGTGGFLVQSIRHVVRKNTSEEGVIKELAEDCEAETEIYTGDLLTEAARANLQNDFANGFDFDATMLRLSAMNLFMHGIDAPHIYNQDSLSHDFAERHPKLESEAFDVVLANPPFKGVIDNNTIAPDLLRVVKTTKTELLFIPRILRMMKLGGRSATIVPQGVLFGSSKAHIGVRQLLVEENQLEMVIDMPSGVFKPYAGVATAVLIFVKGGQTSKVLFAKMEADGLSLDDKRLPVNENDIPSVLDMWHVFKSGQELPESSLKHTLVIREELEAQDYDLSFSRYFAEPYEKVQYEQPSVILGRLADLECEIQNVRKALEDMLK